MTTLKPALPAYPDNIRIILTRTSHPANIGSAARDENNGSAQTDHRRPKSDGNADDGKPARV